MLLSQIYLVQSLLSGFKAVLAAGKALQLPQVGEYHTRFQPNPIVQDLFQRFQGWF